MIIQCATCTREIDGRCPIDLLDSGNACVQYGKWEESTIAKAIREEERGRIVKLIEAKLEDVKVQLARQQDAFTHSVYEEKRLKGQRLLCQELLRELQAEPEVDNEL